MIESFQKFFASFGFMGIVYCQNSLIGELFWHSRIYGYDFQKFSGFMGILLRNFSRFIGGTFTIWMPQPRILETQVTPPPWGGRLITSSSFHFLHGTDRMTT